MRTARYFTFALIALSLAFPARAEAPREALRERIEQLRAGRDVRVDGDSVAAPALVAAFYEQRDFRPAWTPAREKELVALVEASKSDGLDPSDYHLDALRADNDDAVDRELLCTDSLIRLAYSLYFGKLDPRRLDPKWNFARTLDGIDPPRALEAMIAAPSLGDALYAYAPQMPEYLALRRALARYRALRAAGGWWPPRQGRRCGPDRAKYRWRHCALGSRSPATCHPPRPPNRTYSTPRWRKGRRASSDVTAWIPTVWWDAARAPSSTLACRHASTRSG